MFPFALFSLLIFRILVGVDLLTRKGYSRYESL